MARNDFGVAIYQGKGAIGSRDHAANRASSGRVNHGIAPAEKCVSCVEHVGALKVNEYIRIGMRRVVVFERHGLAVKIQLALLEKGLLRQGIRRRGIEM